MNPQRRNFAKFCAGLLGGAALAAAIAAPVHAQTPRPEMGGTLTIAGGVGQVEYDTDPTEIGKLLLVFDPRGALIEVSQGGTVYMNLSFPSN